MPIQSAGLLLFRTAAHGVEVLLVHPGGPFWARRDLGAWTIPKGLPNEGEELLDAARREFEEETGFAAGEGAMTLGQVRQPNGKLVYAWAVRGDADPTALSSNTFELEWPPRSGKLRQFPEVDRAEWFTIEEARRKIAPAQVAFLKRLTELLRNG
jgi:predicted NUDIX family NTP pyrophosphohydrolase